MFVETKVVALYRELNSCVGKRHSDWLTYGDDIGHIATTFVLNCLKLKHMSTTDCSQHLVMIDFVLRAFVGFGNYLLVLISIKSSFFVSLVIKTLSPSVINFLYCMLY